MASSFRIKTLCTFTVGWLLASANLVHAHITSSDPRMETVQVWGQQSRQQLENEVAFTPGSVTLLDSDELYRRSVATMADMLRYVPGVWAASGATADSTFFSSRGSNLDSTNYDGNGVKLLQDGLPVTAADGNNHNRMIDPLAARNVIVAHGANALTYGASTLGGAIDFITPTARDTESQLFLSGGSHGDQQARVTLTLAEGNFDGLATLESRRYDGYRDHQKQQRSGIYTNSGWHFSDALHTRFFISYINNAQELPGALTRDQWREDPEQAEAAALAGDYQLNVESWRIANKTDWDIDNNRRLSFGVSYEEQSLYHPIVFNPFFSLLIDTEQENAGITLRYHWRLADHDLLMGLNYGTTTVKGGNYAQHGGHRLHRTVRVDNDADSLELFVVDRWQFAAGWTLVYGAQGVIAHREVRNITVTDGTVTNPSGSYETINPRFGLIYQLTPDIELYSNLSWLYEPPTTYELEDGIRGDGTALKAMRGLVAEIGSRGRQTIGADSFWQWDVALYYAKLEDEILSVENPSAPGTHIAGNVEDTIHAGLEALASASLALDQHGHHRLEPLISLTLNAFSFDDDVTYGDNDLPAAPGYFVRGELLYRHSSGFYLGPTFDWVDERYADFRNSFKIDSYALVGLRAGFATESWELWSEARNLTGRDHIALFRVSDLASAADAILTPGEPRSVYFGIRWRF